jgi:hypothetical protein
MHVIDVMPTLFLETVAKISQLVNSRNSRPILGEPKPASIVLLQEALIDVNSFDAFVRF